VFSGKYNKQIQHKWQYKSRWVNYNIPHIGNSPNVTPRAAEKAKWFGSAPLKNKYKKSSNYSCIQKPTCHNKLIHIQRFPKAKLDNNFSSIKACDVSFFSIKHILTWLPLKFSFFNKIYPGNYTFTPNLFSTGNN